MSVTNLESEFIKDFHREVVKSTIKNIMNVPLPPQAKEWVVKKEEPLFVKGIEDDFYKGLNSSLVWRLPKNTVVKKRKISKEMRNFQRDSNGNFIYDDVKIPNKSMVCISEISLGLPYGYRAENFGYVDYTIDKGVKKFLYIIPRVYLYPVHQTALVVSVKNMNHLEGMAYKTWRMGTIYLHIIPYKPNNSYTGSRILLTKTTDISYSEEINTIVKYWESVGFIPNIQVCETSSGNLVSSFLDSGCEDFTQVDELSLGDVEIYGANNGD